MEAPTEKPPPATIAAYKGTVAIVALYSAVALVVIVALFFQAGREALLEDWRAFTVTLMAGIVVVSAGLLLFIKTSLSDAARTGGNPAAAAAAAPPPEDLVACPDYWQLSIDPAQPIDKRYKCTPSVAAFGEPATFATLKSNLSPSSDIVAMKSLNDKIKELTSFDDANVATIASNVSNTSNFDVTCSSNVYPVAWARADRALNCGSGNKACNPTLGRCTTAQKCGYTWSAVCK